MIAQDTFDALGAIKGDPNKLAVVVIGKAGRHDDPLLGSHICHSRLVIGAVEDTDLPRIHDPVLYDYHFRWGAAAHHKGPFRQILHV